MDWDFIGDIIEDAIPDKPMKNPWVMIAIVVIIIAVIIILNS